MTSTRLHALMRSEDPVRVIDVRTPGERAIATIEGSELVPVEAFRDGTAYDLLGPVDPAVPLVFFCKSGGRSAEAVRLYQEHTGRAAISLDGGVQAWTDEVDASLARY